MKIREKETALVEDKRQVVEELIDIIVRGERDSCVGGNMQEDAMELVKKVKKVDFVDLEEMVGYFAFQQGQKISELLASQNKSTGRNRGGVGDFMKNNGINHLEVFICAKALVEEQLKVRIGVREYEKMKKEASCVAVE